jgi:hypothetical protein
MHGPRRITKSRQRAMQAGRARARLERPAPDYPPERPLLRRRITVEDYDSGQAVVAVLVLYRSARTDCYRAELDGETIPGKIGWSRALAILRTRFQRMKSLKRGI